MTTWFKTNGSGLSSSLHARLAVLLLALAAAAAGAAPAQAFTVSGGVYGGGSPLPNTLVEALQDGTLTVVDSDTTDAGGQYSLALAAGTYDLRVSPPGGSGYGDETIQNLVVGGDVSYDVILLGQGSSGLSGTVTGYGGNPIANASVTIYGSGGAVASTTTDATGRYVAGLPNGSYTVYVYNGGVDADAPAYAQCGQAAVVSGNTVLDVSYPVAVVSGAVFGAGAGALPGASLQVSSSYYLSALQKSCSSNGSTTTNAAGNYSIAIIHNTAGYLAAFTIQPPSGQPYAIVTQSSFVSGDTTLDFTLPSSSGQGISGTVYGYSGNPIAGDQVRLYTTNGTFLTQAVTDASGHYSFNSSDGSYRIEVNNYSTQSPFAPTNGYYCQRNVTASGPTVLDVTVPVIQVSGVVRDESSAPVAGALLGVTATHQDATTYCNANASVTADGSGAYSVLTVSNAAPRVTTFGVRPPAGSTTLAAIGDAASLGSDATRDFVLPSAAAHSLSGVLRGDGGNPVSPAQAYLDFRAYATSLALGFQSIGSSGAFDFAVGDGDYFLTAYGYFADNAPSEYFYCTRPQSVAGPVAADFQIPLARISGRVTDSNGAPVAGVEIETRSDYYDPIETDYCYGQDVRTSSSTGSYDSLAILGTADFVVTPPTASGFQPVFVNDLALDGDRSQVIVLQRPDITPPDIVSGPTVIHLSDTSVSIVWTTNEAADSLVEFGIGGLTQSVSAGALTTQHIVTLTGLDADTVYTYRVGSTDGSGNGPTYSGTSTFSTEIPPGDITAPVITSGPQLAFVDPSSAILVWNTDEPASSVVHYGLTNGLGETVSGPSGVYSIGHSVQLVGLLPDTTYYYLVESTDPDGNGPTTSTIFSFHTPTSADTTPPAISNVQITDVTDTTITIEWDTDEPATSGVSFNDGVVYDVLSDPTLVLHHVMTLSSLTLGTTYHLTVSSTDVIGNGPSVAGPVDATTGAPCYDAGVACDDGNACTDGDVCDGAGGCAGSAITCNDGSSCTRDSCEPLAGCVYTVEPLPAASCRNPGRSVLVLKDNGDDSRDHVLWKWLLGDTPLSAFGAPTSATSYGLCVYDDAFGSYRAVMNAEISPVAGWTPFPRGFTYLDKTRSRQGVQKLHLLQGAGTKSKVLFVGHGAALNLPLPGTALPLWQTSQVVVQLSNSDGECWQSTFAAPARRNQPGVFRDVAP